ncbi:cholinephosphotransferase 1-like [Centruroides sculpturatus]|uniref:cholinephosphotransferase 1-like n=1 Tax=Centruroides sculpturatus TaxID=218467 RepID=UPI000C6D5EF1|nr:cholinephosphotransferase 1-like [Centruroides sculpturatus]
MIFSSNDILTPTQLKKLSNHEYSALGLTLLDPYVQPYWNWIVEKFPIWFAPNLMTILGLLINVVTSLLLVYFSPDARQEAPRWSFFLCALGLFIYQTLDACDGKQARRTKTSSPLGELFDHGCDSLSTVFVSLGVCIAVQLGTYPAWMFFQCFTAITLFYCAHWQTYVSGILRFGKFDVTEAQFSIMVVHIISAIFGPTIWSLKIPILCIQLKILPTILVIVVVSVVMYGYMIIIFTGGAGKNGSTVAIPYLHVELRLLPVALALTVSVIICYSLLTIILSGGVGKNGSTVAGTSVLSPSIPISLVVIPAFIIYRKSTYNIYENHPCLYILAFGMVASKVTNRLVLVFVSLGVCIAVQLGTYPAWMFFQCFTAITLFYCAHWQTYVSGILRFGKFDVTEAQFSIMVVHIISAIFGPTIWSLKIPILCIQLKILPTILVIVVVSVVMYGYMIIIFTGGAGKNGSTVAIPYLHVELRLLPVALALTVSVIICYSLLTIILSGGVGKNGSTVAGTSVLSPSIPISLVVIPAFIIYRKSTYNIYENHPCLYILAFGMVASKVTNRLVIAHMTKSEMDYLDSILIGPGMLFLNQYFNTFMNEYVVLWLCLVYSAADLFHYCMIVCNQISAHLKIHLFSIAPRTTVVPACTFSTNGTKRTGSTISKLK